MKITVLRKMRYKNTFIYIMQFADIFQYLFAWDGNIYQQNIVFKPNLFKRIAWNLGLISELYSKEQIEDGEKVILTGAMDSIDKLIESGEGTEKAHNERENEIRRVEQRKCQWQAMNNYWLCLSHGEAVEMKDGVKPAHDVTVQANG